MLGFSIKMINGSIITFFNTIFVYIKILLFSASCRLYAVVFAVLHIFVRKGDAWECAAVEKKEKNMEKETNSFHYEKSFLGWLEKELPFFKSHSA